MMISLASQRAAAARASQIAWRETALEDRLACIARIRSAIACEGLNLAQAAGAARERPVAESLTAEVIPLAAACSFLEDEAPDILRSRQVGKRGRPVWLSGVRSEIRREPFGLVLIVGPANYPLFLPGVQALQALAAGNAVLLKPGREGTAAMAALAKIAAGAGLPEGLLQVLPEDPEEVHEALEAGVDLVVFTGSTEAGRKVLAAAAERLIPAIVELSGEDPFLVREDADPELAAQALRFARDLNGGDSCIAPRRICAAASQAPALQARFPELRIQPVANDEAALREAGASSYALGATIISRDLAAARRIAERVAAGVVVINDCLMPTADPRLPFGGRGASGFGSTRGAEGLLAMTRPKVIVVQQGVRRHLQPSRPGDAQLFLAYLQAAHGGGWRSRLAGVRALWRALSRRN